MDLYLQAMLKSQSQTEDKFEIAEKKILAESALNSKKNGEEEQFKCAIQVIFSEGMRYLPESLFLEMKTQFYKIFQTLENMDAVEGFDGTFQDFFQITDAVMEGIFMIAKEKFKEKDYEMCYALFVLLSSLNEENFDHLYRRGIAAQKCKRYDDALESYSDALLLLPQHPGAFLFSAECYLALNQLEMAKNAWIEGKDLDENQEWTDLVVSVEKMIERSGKTESFPG